MLTNRVQTYANVPLFDTFWKLFFVAHFGRGTICAGKIFVSPELYGKLVVEKRGKKVATENLWPRAPYHLLNFSYTTLTEACPNIIEVYFRQYTSTNQLTSDKADGYYLTKTGEEKWWLHSVVKINTTTERRLSQHHCDTKGESDVMTLMTILHGMYFVMLREGVCP